MSLKIQTANEFLKDNLSNPRKGWSERKRLIEFAKLHVKAALEAAAENVELDYWEGSCRECGSNKVNEKSILNAYPDDNIQ